MKIAFIAFLGFPSKNAGSINVMRSCESMAKLGHEVVLIAPMVHPDIVKDHIGSTFEYYGVTQNFTILKLPNWNGPGGRHFFTTLCSLALLKIRPKLVIGRYLRATLSATKLGFNTVYELHTSIKKKRRQLEQLLSHDNFRLMVAVSTQLREHYLHQGLAGLTPERIIAAPVCREPVNSPPPPASLPKATNGFAIGYFGKLEDQKGIPLLAELAKRVTEHDFHIIGGTPHSIDHWKRRMNYTHVHFHGYIPPSEVGSFIQAMDICLLPNSPPPQNPDGVIYSSPMKAFDYMAHGKMILASDLTELRDILTDEAAIFIPHDRVDMWQKTICSLTSESIKIYGKRAKELFLRRFTTTARWDRVIRESLKGVEI